VLEDCAQAHGAQRAERRAGAFGQAAVFSFYPTKNLGAIGDGGAIVTSDDAVAKRARRLRQYGWDLKYHVTSKGGRNSRLDEIQAAVLRAKLPHLSNWNRRRRDIARRYSTEIDGARVKVPPVRGEEYVAHLYVVQCTDRDDLRKHLSEGGIASDIHYPVPDHRQPVLAGRDWPQLPVTDRASREILSLPCFPELTDAEVGHIIARVNAR
jgi:dTDP-4-amino-4,6-dideoxygalactose transaminase